MQFGLSMKEQLVTTPYGLTLFVPTAFTITESYETYPRIEMSGIIMDKPSESDLQKAALSQFSIIELMEEVQRRCKSGVNIKEERKVKGKAI
jgi:hypothetical protein